MALASDFQIARRELAWILLPISGRAEAGHSERWGRPRELVGLCWSVFREERFFLVLSVFIGIFSGLAVVCFRFAIDWCRIYLLGSGSTLSPARLLLAPSLAGLVIAVLVIHVFPLARGSGVNQTKAALYIYNGYIPLRTAIGKFITAALAIGSGHSLGPEDPSLQIGASLASALGRRMRLSRDRMRLIAPVGAAAGLAAAFNAPISAVLFVIEEVIGRWTAGILGSVVLSAVSSVVVMRWFLGSESLFRIPAVQLERPSELIAYSILGVVGGLASVAFSSGIGELAPAAQGTAPLDPVFSTRSRRPADRAHRCPGRAAGHGSGLRVHRRGHARPIHLANAGHPGGTQDRCDVAFVRQRNSRWHVCANVVYRRHAGRIGRWAQHVRFLPHLAVSPGTYALVGMGVLFAGFLRAPMTSVFMVLEVSGNYSIIVPVIVANTIAYAISRGLQPVRRSLTC